MKNNKDLSKLFSTSRWNGVPLYKLAASALVVVMLLAGAGVVLAAGVRSGAQPGPTATPTASPTATPTAAPTEAPTPTPSPTPEPVNVKLEATSTQQDVGVEVLNAEDSEPVIGVPFMVTLTDEAMHTGTYAVDTHTATVLVEDLEPGDYIVGLQPIEGYILPECVVVTVKEKVIYKADTEAVKDKIVQAEEVVESEEDNSFGNASAPIEEELKNTADLVESTKEEIVVDKTIYTKAKLDDEGYMLLKDGTATDYKPVTGKLADGKEVVVGAKRVLRPTPTPTATPEATATPEPTFTPEPTATATPTATPEGTATPEPTFTPEPTAEPTTAPTATPEATATAAPTAEPTAEPTAAPTAEPAAEPTAEPTTEPTAEPQAVNLRAAGGLRVMPLGMRVMPLTTTDYTQWPDEITFFDVNTYASKDLDKYTFDLSTAIVNVKTGEYLYTGWQDINGYSYYYTADHKPLTGSQVIDGVMYEFDETGALKRNSRGVDVSKYQGNIDWKAVKASGIDFAIIRVGYRGYGSGKLVEDSTFKANIQGATAAGLRVGLYFYSQAINEEEAVEEASMVLSLCKGYNISYPIFFDTEKVAGDVGRADSIGKATRTACAVAFCETIRNAGYQAGVYSYASWFYNELNLANLSKYKIWIAQYRDTLSFNSRYDIWQYTSQGVVPGIPTNVDMNIGY